MNAVNSLTTWLFDVLLWPFDQLGRPWALVLGSAVFGVFALYVFKHVSAQRRIKAVKQRIAGHLIEIRIYQDDLPVASKAIGRVLRCNLQYLGLNLLPLVPLALPFALVLAQFVVRYGYDGAALTPAGQRTLAGGGALIAVRLDSAHAAAAGGLALELPAGVEALSPLVRSVHEGAAWQEIVVRAAGEHELVVALADGTRATKRFAAGAPARRMQPERGSGFWSALLWPVEPGFGSDEPFASIVTELPESELGWLPGGPGGVLLVFVVVSMLSGALAMKPLKVSI